MYSHPQIPRQEMDVELETSLKAVIERTVLLQDESLLIPNATVYYLSVSMYDCRLVRGDS